MNELVEKFRAGQLQAIDKRRVARLRQIELEFLPPLLEIQETPPSPWQHRVLWVLFAFLALGLGWSALGKVAIVASAPGQFVPKGKVKVVQPLGSGTVKAILVHAGESVRRGQPLVELNPTVKVADAEATRGQLALSESQQRRLEAQLGLAPNPVPQGQHGAGPGVESALQVAEEAAYQTELDAAQARMSQVGAEIAAGRATLDSLAQSKAILQEQLNGSSALVAMGAIARDDALRLQRQYIDTSGRLAAQREDMLKLAAERVAAQQGVAQVQARYRRDVLRSLESNTDTRMRLQASNARAQQDLALQWLRSPVDGIVQEVAVSSVGEVVSPGQKVVTVVPKNEPLEVEVDLANQDVAFVRVGQPVQIKVAAFPFEQYGVIPGRVVQISPDAAPSGATGATGSAPAGGLVYRVRVQAERTTLAVHGKPVSMRPGMVVQADIQTGRRTILSFLIDPFKRNLDEGLSVR